MLPTAWCKHIANDFYLGLMVVFCVSIQRHHQSKMQGKMHGLLHGSCMVLACHLVAIMPVLAKSNNNIIIIIIYHK